MQIVVIGQAAFGAKVLEALLDRGERVVGAFAPPDRPGGKADPMKQAAVSRGVPVLQPATYKSDDAFEAYRSLKPDLAILAFVTSIIPERFFSAAPMGAICYHPSLLPRHRGASAINWAVAMGDAKTGLTIFWPDGGIDTGPILLQKEVDIQESDTTGSLYFNHLFPMGVDAILESVALIREGKAPRITQEETGATYEPPFDDRVAAIDWQKPGRDLFNLIRASDPQPGAYTVCRGEKVRLYGPRYERGSTGKAPGTVVDIGSHGIQIAVSEGIVLVGKVRAGKADKGNAADFASGTGLRVGDFFGD